MSDLESRVRERFAQLQVVPSESELSQMLAYFGLLAKWNANVNLTAFSLDSPSVDAIDRLLIEPLVAAAIVKAQFESTPGALLLDLGSGGGSPAIPLKIALPHLKLMMVESREKKSAFLREAVRHVKLGGVEVLNARIEALAGLAGQLAPELVSVRAVRTDREFWQAAGSLLRPGGRVLWFRTDPLASELPPSEDQAQLPDGFRLEATHSLVSANSSQLAILRKTP